MDHLAKHNIPSMIYYNIPLHRQKAFDGFRKDYAPLDISEHLSEVIFSIPMHPYLTDDDISAITRLIKEHSCR
jgi:dTDP-4-amino-4,6-dideoxygalactose transaminase